MTALAPHLTAFLREHLPRERDASPHTVATYAHCFALLVRFAAKQLDRRPSDLEIQHLDPDLLLRFLDQIETDRGNSARTRNARLIATRTFFRYLEYQVPACLDQALRIRALPQKRTDDALIDYLTREEIEALLAAPDPRAVSGARDRAMLHLTYAAGLRVAELLSLCLDNFPDRSLATVRVKGKGRTRACPPLMARDPSYAAGMASGPPASQDTRVVRLAQHVAIAAQKQLSLLQKRVTPHVLRHSCAMHTLAATGDIRKVALWLGHASIRTTETYLRVDPAEKLAVLAAHAPLPIEPGRFKPPSDKLLTMLAEVRNGK
jgi:integrase/recombinase XerD